MEYFASGKDEVKQQIEGLPNSGGVTTDNIQLVFNTAYALAGLVAAGFIVYGGIQYIIAKGDAGKIAKAKNSILYAVIGLIIVLLAASITAFVTSAASEANGGSSDSSEESAASSEVSVENISALAELKGRNRA